MGSHFNVSSFLSLDEVMHATTPPPPPPPPPHLPTLLHRNIQLQGGQRFRSVRLPEYCDGGHREQKQ